MAKHILDFPQNDEELHDMLNEHFYKHYDTEHFLNKSMLLAGNIQHTEDIKKIVNSPLQFKKLKIDSPDIDAKWLVRYSKQEIVINYYHAAESLLRLVIAHAEFPECPWHGILQLNSSEEFRKRLKEINDGTYFFDGQRKALEQLFYIHRKAFPKLSDEEWEENLDGLENIFNHIASSVGTAADYNVFKHGGTLFSTELGLSINNLQLAEKQEAFMFLGYSRDKLENYIETKTFRVVKFLRWEEKIAETYLTTQLMQNLFEAKRLRLGIGKDAKLHSFKGVDVMKILLGGEKSQIVTTDMKFPLTTYREARVKKEKS